MEFRISVIVTSLPDSEKMPAISAVGGGIALASLRSTATFSEATARTRGIVKRESYRVRIAFDGTADRVQASRWTPGKERRFSPRLNCFESEDR